MKETLEFIGKEAYEEFCLWTNDVDLQPFEISKIVVDYKKIKRNL